MANVIEIVNLIWKAGTIEDQSVSQAIDSLPADMMDKIVGAYTYLQGNDINYLVNESDLDWRSIDTASLASSQTSDDIIKEVFACFYLSEHKLDEYTQGSNELRQAMLSKLAKEWKVDKDLLLKIYINWCSLKKYLEG